MGVNGNKIKLLRKLNGDRQTDLAERCSVGRSMIANVETGYAEPSPMLLSQISAAYLVPSAYFSGELKFPVSDTSLKFADFYIKEKYFVCPVCGERYNAAIHYDGKEACFKCFRKDVENVDIDLGDQ
jgi:transcriptional regulator with XRE-family HTH domain